ncbi:MAG: ribonuclease III [Candidatus Dormibacteraeota bacterium]|uniref:Ribonuclease 3 n=1 Tax=Candidatus Dormiibacter inghamiae TaxID=3127013 RepID=A0A934KKF8_9BACT|nr:ribonuclease III [Candidatus Dormibacteraeota bacterium]MBJ7605169.1 ribonuclease III [Candidatus Dormibacteraeota bacterium]
MQERIGIAFKNPSLLQEALTHSSFANESPHLSPRDNERLEYLGDAVLQLITADYLFKLRPGAHEGEMTQVRSAMVNTNTLALLGENLGLGGFLYLGKGIAKGGGRSLKSLLANAFEAVLGAIFLDAGFDAAYHHYLAQFRALPEPLLDENHKGRLQRVVQDLFNRAPVYDSVGAGVGRRREYTAVVYAGSEALGTGHSSTKQGAEQDAALAALARLEGAGSASLPGASVVAAPATSPLNTGNGLTVPRRRSRGGRRRTDLTAAADRQPGRAPGVPAEPREAAREAAQPVPGEPPFLNAGGEPTSAETEHPVPGEPPFVAKAAAPRGSRAGRRRSATAGGGQEPAGRPGASPGGQAEPAAAADQPAAEVLGSEQLTGPPVGVQGVGSSVSPALAPAREAAPSRRSRGRRRRGASDASGATDEAGAGDGSAMAALAAAVSAGVPAVPEVATARNQTAPPTQRSAAGGPAPDSAAATPLRSSAPVRRRSPRPRRPPSPSTGSGSPASAQT